MLCKIEKETPRLGRVQWTTLHLGKAERTQLHLGKFESKTSHLEKDDRKTPHLGIDERKTPPLGKDKRKTPHLGNVRWNTSHLGKMKRKTPHPSKFEKKTSHGKSWKESIASETKLWSITSHCGNVGEMKDEIRFYINLILMSPTKTSSKWFSILVRNSWTDVPLMWHHTERQLTKTAMSRPEGHVTSLSCWITEV